MKITLNRSLLKVKLSAHLQPKQYGHRVCNDTPSDEALNDDTDHSENSAAEGVVVMTYFRAFLSF